MFLFRRRTRKDSVEKRKVQNVLIERRKREFNERVDNDLRDLNRINKLISSNY